MRQAQLDLAWIVLLKDYDMKKIFYGFVGILFAACNQKVDVSDDVNNVKVDFKKIYSYAKKAKDAYASETDIEKTYSDKLVFSANLEKTQGHYFVLKDVSTKEIFISIRGTANIKNALKDAEYTKNKDNKLAILLHKGFNESTDELYENLQSHIIQFKKEFTFNITGHSLGGAMAVILMMHLQVDGYKLGSVITFGQPKVTNEKGVKQVDDSPLLRIINNDDLVPLVPPRSLVSATHGFFRHMGPEIILLGGEAYIHLSHGPAEKEDVTAFWNKLGHQSLKDHFMDNYLAQIKSKLERSKEVPYSDKKNFEK